MALVSVALSGCLFKGTSERVARKEAESRASTERGEAIARKDFAVALAYDDAFLIGGDVPQLRADRKNHFARLFDAELAKVGTLTDDNVWPYVGTLVAFRHETRRSLAVLAGERTVKDDEPFAKAIAAALQDQTVALYQAGTKQRQSDLAIVDTDRIVPRLVEAAGPAWHAIDAVADRGALAAAVTLAHAVMDELPSTNDFETRFAELKAKAAAVHLALAQQAGDGLPGARVLHARIAAIYGAQVGPLGEPNAALIAETTQNWTLSSPGDCGASPLSIGSKLDSLETRLRTEGYTSNTGQPMQLTVAFESCPVTKREFQTEDELPYQEMRTQQIRIEEPAYQCASSTTSSESHRTGDYIYTATTTMPGRCTQVGTTTRIEERQVMVDLIEKIPIEHLLHKIAVTGTIRIGFEGGTREERFSLEAESDDDSAWQRAIHGKAEHAGSHSHSGLSEPQARDRLHAQLLTKIRALTGQALAVREAAYVDKAKASIVQGQALEADQAFYVANRIVQLAGTTNPAFTEWMATHYRVTPVLLIAAIAGAPLPKDDLAAGHTVIVKPVAIRLGDDVESVLTTALTMRSFRSLLFASITAGPSFTSTTGGSGSIHGGIVSFQLAGFGHRKSDYTGGFEPASGGGLRISGGYDGNKSGLVDLDFFLGYGLRYHWLSIDPIAGFGLDFTSSNNDGVSIAPDVFKLPVGAYGEYGLRVAYAFEPDLTLEAIYTKAFRTASALPRDKRVDLRLATVLPGGFPLGITVRYAEYLTMTEGDGFFTPFSATDRAAKTFWLLGGMGF